jgi:hypothetical protein
LLVKISAETVSSNRLQLQEINDGTNTNGLWDDEFGDGSSGGGAGGWTRPPQTTVHPFSYPLPLYWLQFYNLTAYEVLDVDVLTLDFEAELDSTALRRTMKQVNTGANPANFSAYVCCIVCAVP